MNSEEKTEYVKKISLYMEKNKIYSIFENLYKSLMMEKPSNPISFLIEKIKFKSSNLKRKTNIYSRPSWIKCKRSSFKIK